MILAQSHDKPCMTYTVCGLGVSTSLVEMIEMFWIFDMP